MSSKSDTIFHTNQNDYVLSIENLETPLGRGAFSSVYKVTDKQGNEYALKCILKKHIDIAKDEISLMISISKTPGCGNANYYIDSGENSRCIFIIMPYCNNGTLVELNNKILTEEEAIEYFRQICYGMKILRYNHIIHRDLKMANILVSSYHDSLYPYNNALFIADFGLSTTKSIELTKQVGTSFTQAPEVDTGKYNKNCDIYSLGCILYRMMSKCEPFQGKDANIIQSNKNADKLSIASRFNKPLSKFTMELLEGCLQYDQNTRLKYNEIDQMLDVNNLYSNFKQIVLGEVDTSSEISMKLYKRKPIIKKIYSRLTMHHTSTISIKGDTNKLIDYSAVGLVNVHDFKEAEANVYCMLCHFKSQPVSANKSQSLQLNTHDKLEIEHINKGSDIVHKLDQLLDIPATNFTATIRSAIILYLISLGSIKLTQNAKNDASKSETLSTLLSMCYQNKTVDELYTYSNNKLAHVYLLCIHNVD